MGVVAGGPQLDRTRLLSTLVRVDRAT